MQLSLWYLSFMLISNVGFQQLIGEILDFNAFWNVFLSLFWLDNLVYYGSQ